MSNQEKDQLKLKQDQAKRSIEKGYKSNWKRNVVIVLAAIAVLSSLGFLGVLSSRQKDAESNMISAYMNQYFDGEKEKKKQHILYAIRTTFGALTTKDTLNLRHDPIEQTIHPNQRVVVMLRDANKIIVGYFDEKGDFKSTIMGD